MSTESNSGGRQGSGPQDRRESWIARATIGLVRDEARALWSWGLVIGAALVFFWLSETTPYHQFAIGTLLSLATLFVLVGLFEILWRALVEQEP